jgi:hypothetical protein
MRPPIEDDVLRVAWAILTARFYDCEPEMYSNDEGVFRASTVWDNHGDDAVAEARAAIKAMSQGGSNP